MRNPVITLLTDFGTADHYVAAMKGVILGICPGARLVDISHETSPFAIAEAAYTLAQAWSCFPAGTVHLVVVDPGVGSSRRPILAEAGGHRFVAPDNGVLTMTLAQTAKPRVREITATRYFRKPVSQTFHGRDIFAPVTAHLARGTPAGKLGRLLHDYVRLANASAVPVSASRWKGHVLKIDRFGNIITSFETATWDRIAGNSFCVTIGERSISRLATAYAEISDRDPFLIRGSAGYIEISIHQGNAANLLDARIGTPVDLLLQ
jgi:S-adenosylmethionine hydrolase